MHERLAEIVETGAVAPLEVSMLEIVIRRRELTPQEQTELLHILSTTQPGMSIEKFDEAIATASEKLQDVVGEITYLRIEMGIPKDTELPS